MKKIIDIFNLSLEYEGTEIQINPVKDALFQSEAKVEKEESSALLAFYGSILASQRKQLANLKLVKSRWEAKKRSIVIEDIKDDDEKVTESAIQSRFDLNPEYQEIQDKIIDIEFNIGVLEQGGVWALKSKSDHVKESIRAELMLG
jgi:hypothetical protein